MNFNPAHWHLLVNHLPITGNFIVILVLLYGMARKSDAVIKASYWLFALMAVFAVIAMQTGEEAAHFLLDANLADKAIIAPHVQASNFAQWAMIIVGLVALAALFFNRLKTSRAMPVIILLLSLFASTIMFRTGLLGGEIMHKEIRTNDTLVLPGK